MKKLFCALALVWLLSSATQAQDRGLLMKAAQDLGPQVQIGKQWAVFIAIDR